MASGSSSTLPGHAYAPGHEPSPDHAETLASLASQNQTLLLAAAALIGAVVFLWLGLRAVAAIMDRSIGHTPMPRELEPSADDRSALRAAIERSREERRQGQVLAEAARRRTGAGVRRIVG